jgi:hypothetical protein
VTIPSEAAALFAGPLRAYFGVQPNQAGNINQSAEFTRVSITGGVQSPLAENFTGVTNDTQTVPNLDPAVWERVSQDNAGVILVPPSASWWLTWTVPAVGFQLQESATLAPDSWVDVTAPAQQLGGQMRTLISPETVPDTQHAYFRLRKAPQEPAAP